MQDPFTPIARKPKFGQLARHQKIIIAVCLTIIALIGAVVFGTRWVPIPGRDLGVLVRHNIDFLGENITLPRRPLAVTWQMLPHDDASTSDAASATHWRLTAVLEFSAEDTAALLAAARDEKPAPDDEIEPENWFPAAVATAMADRPMRYIDPAPFFGGLYHRGAAAQIEGTDYFVVRLISD
ncbi:MAG: hypothetical protein ACOY3L_04460 [Pseudomonadota bacterium]